VTSRHDPWHVLLGGIVLSGVGVVLIGLSPTVLVLLATIVVFAAGASLIGPVQKSLTNMLAPQELRAGAVSVAIISQAIGQTLGPMVMGAMLTFVSPAATFVLTGAAVTVVGVLLVALVLLLDRRG
jgi:MFS family permease